MNLFIKDNITLSSGVDSDFKIECDVLTDEDLECISYLISKKLKFKKVVGVPTGGIRLEQHLQKYCIEDDSLPILICDDVLTTGNSMVKMKQEIHDKNIIGTVIFSRGKSLEWITPLFQIMT